MLAPQVLQIPHLLEDQFVWLSIAAWCVLLAWLRQQISRRRLLAWTALAGALHLTPVAAQAIWAGSAIPLTAGDMPVAYWALEAVNVLVLAMVVGIWYVSRRHTPHSIQAEAVMAERRRIASDLHDGVGSRLVALLASQDPKSGGPGSLSMALQACLLELQMTVDDLDDQGDSTVVERLGHLRYRLRPAFERMGITFEWSVAAETESFPMPAETASHVCRVAQEALSNALRHSRASRVELRVAPQEHGRAMVLEVCDNGAGLGQPGPAGHLGKGLRSMHSRAQVIGAKLDIGPAAPHGLRVRLVVPCGPTAAAAQPSPGAGAESQSML